MLMGLDIVLNSWSQTEPSLVLQKDELRRLLTAKEKQQEESLRSIEALKSKLRHYEVYCSSTQTINMYFFINIVAIIPVISLKTKI